MKALKKLLAVVVSLVMAIGMMGTAFAADHTYEIYQILTGNVSDSGELENIGKGQNFKSTADLTAAVNAITAIDSSATDQAKLDVILQYVDLTTPYTTLNAGETSAPDLPDGYYLVKDKDGSLASDGNDAYTTYIVMVVNGDLTISPKSAIPTVDKQVQDETEDAESGATDGWGESADHEINESFQFKLTATLPDDDDILDYESYKVVFTDTMSSGVTFESIESVKVNNTTLTAKQYTLSDDAVNGKAGITFTITIADIVPYLGSGNTLKGATIEVIYNAHLNESADVNKESVEGQTNNQNKVKLDYSNNPNVGASGSTGSTEYDYVFVLTYTNDYTKYDATIPSNKVALEGVGFKLYASDKTTEIPMYKGTGGAYYPVGSSGNTGGEILTDSSGQFELKGLDAGTYVLKETKKASDEYNDIEPITITIDATHVENANKTSVNLTLTQTNDGDTEIDNSKGTSLPSTGGIGTTIFYVVGGVLMVSAAVLLITKKRMEGRE